MLGRFAPSIRASPSILGRFAPSLRASPSIYPLQNLDLEWLLFSYRHLFFPNSSPVITVREIHFRCIKIYSIRFLSGRKSRPRQTADCPASAGQWDCKGGVPYTIVSGVLHCAVIFPELETPCACRSGPAIGFCLFRSRDTPHLVFLSVFDLYCWPSSRPSCPRNLNSLLCLVQVCFTTPATRLASRRRLNSIAGVRRLLKHIISGDLSAPLRVPGSMDMLSGAS